MNEEIIFKNKYLLLDKLGKGSFGVVYKGLNKQTNEYVAIKVETVEDPPKDRCLLLENEYKIYKQLKNVKCVPKIYCFITNYKNMKLLIMQLLGDSLETLFHNNGGHFSLKTVLMIGIQLIHTLEEIHASKLLHRDLKPENFLIGTDDKAKYIYMIDFGLAKPFKNEHNVHMKITTGKKLIGTSRYASINSHIGNDLSRRDDLESLCYILIYFFKGKLPWQGAPGETREVKYKNIGDIKQSIKVERLCSGMPEEFCYYLNYVKSLEFKEKPNYNYLLSLFINVMKREKYLFDYIYDWTI